MTINLNDEVTVRLTERGRSLMLQCGWELPERIPPAGQPYRVQLWVLMRGIGPKMGMGADAMIERNEIVLAVNE